MRGFPKILSLRAGFANDGAGGRRRRTLFGSVCCTVQATFLPKQNVYLTCEQAVLFATGFSVFFDTPRSTSS